MLHIVQSMLNYIVHKVLVLCNLVYFYLLLVHKDQIHNYTDYPLLGSDSLQSSFQLK